MSTAKESKKKENDKAKKSSAKKTESKNKSQAKSASNKQNKALEETKANLAAEKDKYLRLFAEFENFKKRTSKERIELFKTAGQEVITSLLPVVDDFQRALAEVEKLDNANDFEGFQLINNKLYETLKNKGLTEVEVNVGDAFDAEIHEAITQIPAGDDQSGKIIDITAKGYQLGEKIIRYPKVVVGQ